MECYLADAYAGFGFDYRGEEVSYLPSRGSASGTRAKVRTTVLTAGRLSVHVDYAVRQLGDVWKVYDVIANGVSLLTL